LGPLFDNKDRFEMQVERKRLALIKQFVDGPTMVRITDDPAGTRYAVANSDEANSYVNTLVDIVFGRSGEKASVRQGLAQAMMEMLKGMPEDMQRIALPLVVEMSDVPKKHEFIQKIEAANQMLMGGGLPMGSPSPQLNAA
jgi:uncharacterized protein (DUF1810 family)